jgi:uncharacterized membrane protein
MPWRRESNSSNSSSASTMERAISAFCYPTGGIVGIIYIIISRSSYQSNFFRFHFLQSIILVLMSMLLNWAFSAMGIMLGPLVPHISDMLSKMTSPDTASIILGGIGGVIGAIFIAIALVGVYGFIWAALGKYAEIPVISNVVRQQMR